MITRKTENNTPPIVEYDWGTQKYKQWTWNSNETWDHLTEIFNNLFGGTSLRYIIRMEYNDGMQGHPREVEIYEIPSEGSQLLPWGVILPGSTLWMGNGNIRWTYANSPELKTFFSYRILDSAPSTPPTNSWGDTGMLGTLGTQRHTLWEWKKTFSERDIIMTLESLFEDTPVSFKILHPRSGCGGMISYGPPDRIVIYHTQTFEMLDVHLGECLWVDSKRVVLLSEKMEVGAISFVPEEKLDPKPDEWASYIEEMKKKDTILRNNTAPHKGCARDGCDGHEDPSDCEQPKATYRVTLDDLKIPTLPRLNEWLANLKAKYDDMPYKYEVSPTRIALGDVNVDRCVAQVRFYDENYNNTQASTVSLGVGDTIVITPTKEKGNIFTINPDDTDTRVLTFKIPEEKEKEEEKEKGDVEDVPEEPKDKRPEDKSFSLELPGCYGSPEHGYVGYVSLECEKDEEKEESDEEEDDCEYEDEECLGYVDCEDCPGRFECDAYLSDLEDDNNNDNNRRYDI